MVQHAARSGQAVRTLQEGRSAGERLPKQRPLPFQPPFLAVARSFVAHMLLAESSLVSYASRGW